MTYTLKTTKTFDDWLKSLKDLRAYATIQRRLDRVEAGNLGDHKSVGDGISEMRIHVGAGYRLYYTLRGREVVFLLVGGDKSSQQTDIATAKKLTKELHP